MSKNKIDKEALEIDKKKKSKQMSNQIIRK